MTFPGFGKIGFLSALLVSIPTSKARRKFSMGHTVVLKSNGTISWKLAVITLDFEAM